MQAPDTEGLAAVACNWEAKCVNRSASGSTQLLRRCIAVETLTQLGAAPQLSTVAAGGARCMCFSAMMRARCNHSAQCVVACIFTSLFYCARAAAIIAPCVSHPSIWQGSIVTLTPGQCSDALEFQLRLEVRPPPSPPPFLAVFCSRSISPRRAGAGCDTYCCRCLLRDLRVVPRRWASNGSAAVPVQRASFAVTRLTGEYVASARAQHHQALDHLSEHAPDTAAPPPQDLRALRLFLFDCTDVPKSSSKIMLRLRRSISACAPDISLGTITIYSRIVRSLTPPPIMDIEKAAPPPARARAL